LKGVTGKGGLFSLPLMGEERGQHEGGNDVLERIRSFLIREKRRMGRQPGKGKRNPKRRIPLLVERQATRGGKEKMS